MAAITEDSDLSATVAALGTPSTLHAALAGLYTALLAAPNPGELAAHLVRGDAVHCVEKTLATPTLLHMRVLHVLHDTSGYAREAMKASTLLASLVAGLSAARDEQTLRASLALLWKLVPAAPLDPELFETAADAVCSCIPRLDCATNAFGFLQRATAAPHTFPERLLPELLAALQTGTHSPQALRLGLLLLAHILHHNTLQDATLDAIAAHVLRFARDFLACPANVAFDPATYPSNPKTAAHVHLIQALFEALVELSCRRALPGDVLAQLPRLATLPFLSVALAKILVNAPSAHPAALSFLACTLRGASEELTALLFHALQSLEPSFLTAALRQAFISAFAAYPSCFALGLGVVARHHFEEARELLPRLLPLFETPALHRPLVDALFSLLRHTPAEPQHITPLFPLLRQPALHDVLSRLIFYLSHQPHLPALLRTQPVAPLLHLVHQSQDPTVHLRCVATLYNIHLHAPNLFAGEDLKLMLALAEETSCKALLLLVVPSHHHHRRVLRIALSLLDNADTGNKKIGLYALRGLSIDEKGRKLLAPAAVTARLCALLSESTNEHILRITMALMTDLNVADEAALVCCRDACAAWKTHHHLVLVGAKLLINAWQTSKKTRDVALRCVADLRRDGDAAVRPKLDLLLQKHKVALPS